MIQLQQLLKPTWGVEKWLNAAWSVLHDDEKQLISKRVDDLFFNPIPFQIEHDKVLYLHLFSLLTQLEIFGLQGLLKTLNKLPEGELQLKFRQQIVDEIFHAVVFAKITFELAAPYALPPSHSATIEQCLSLMVEEQDLKTSLVLINLVAEGWIEEIFMAIQECKIAPRIFDVIIADESRHLEDSALFLEIGLPEPDYLTKKLERFEEELITMVFEQYTYAQTLINFMGVDGAKKLFDNIDKKHYRLLKKINFTPSKNWRFSMDSIPLLIDDAFHNQNADTLVKQSDTRRIFTAIWAEPNQPTQSSLFSMDVTPIEFFEKKYKPEVLTCLILQALSKAMADNPILKNYMWHHKIYNPKDSFVGLGVLLPDCEDHLSMIEFKNCHEMHVSELAQHIQYDMRIMVYCYKRTQALKKEHPYLMDAFNDAFVPRCETIFNEPFFVKPTISLSNIGHWGYEVPISPLFPNETVKLTLGKIERKQVWNNTSKIFEVRDILPIGISVDHRVFDANIPVPKAMQTAFDDVFMAMQKTAPPKEPVRSATYFDEFIALGERLMETDLEAGFRCLFIASQVWKNHNEIKKHMHKADDYLKEEAAEG